MSYKQIMLENPVVSKFSGIKSIYPQKKILIQLYKYYLDTFSTQITILGRRIHGTKDMVLVPKKSRQDH